MLLQIFLFPLVLVGSSLIKTESFCCIRSRFRIALYCYFLGKIVGAPDSLSIFTNNTEPGLGNLVTSSHPKAQMSPVSSINRQVNFLIFLSVYFSNALPAIFFADERETLSPLSAHVNSVLNDRRNKIAKENKL